MDITELATIPARLSLLEDEIKRLKERLTIAERRPYSIAEAADALGVCQNTIRNRIKNGDIQHRRVGRRVVVYLVAS